MAWRGWERRESGGLYSAFLKRARKREIETNGARIGEDLLVCHWGFEFEGAREKGHLFSEKGG